MDSIYFSRAQSLPRHKYVMEQNVKSGNITVPDMTASASASGFGLEFFLLWEYHSILYRRSQLGMPIYFPARSVLSSSHEPSGYAMLIEADILARWHLKKVPGRKLNRWFRIMGWFTMRCLNQTCRSKRIRVQMKMISHFWALNDSVMSYAYYTYLLPLYLVPLYTPLR